MSAIENLLKVSLASEEKVSQWSLKMTLLDLKPQQLTKLFELT